MPELKDVGTVVTEAQGSSDTSATGFIVDINPDQVSSPALKRLLEEVRNDSAGCSDHSYAYDRVHNRHNRGR